MHLCLPFYSLLFFYFSPYHHLPNPLSACLFIFLSCPSHGQQFGTSGWGRGLAPNPFTATQQEKACTDQHACITVYIDQGRSGTRLAQIVGQASKLQILHQCLCTSVGCLLLSCFMFHTLRRLHHPWLCGRNEWTNRSLTLVNIKSCSSYVSLRPISNAGQVTPHSSQ